MAYEYVSFDGVDLPPYWRETDLSTGQVDDTLIDAVGGTFDIVGDGVRLPRKSPITAAGVYVAEVDYLVDHLGNYIVDHLGNRIITGTSAANLRLQLDALRAKLGVRGRLYRSRLDDEVLQWKRARFLKYNHDATVGDRMSKAHVSAQFASEMVGWRSENPITTSFTLVNGVTSVVIPSVGTTTAHDAFISITASTTITSINVVNTGSGVDWTWTGTLAAAGVLLFDCGLKTIRNSGINAYNGFTLNVAHSADSWLPIRPGNNYFTITANGPSSAAFIQHFDQWL